MWKNLKDGGMKMIECEIFYDQNKVFSENLDWLKGKNIFKDSFQGLEGVECVSNLQSVTTVTCKVSVSALFSDTESNIPEPVAEGRIPRWREPSQQKGMHSLVPTIETHLLASGCCQTCLDEPRERKPRK